VYALYYFPLSIEYFPIFCALLSLITIFFFSRYLFGSFGAFLASITLAVHPRFFVGNFIGFLDTNALNMMLSIVSLCSFYVYWKENDKRFLILSLLAILAFYFTWPGYLYVVAIILLFIIVSSKYKLHALGVSVVLALLNIPFIKTLHNRLFTDSIVGELQFASLDYLIPSYGGLFLSILTLFAIIYALTKYKDPKSIFILCWFSLPFIAGLFAKRFLFYTAPAVVLLLTYAALATLPRLKQLLKNKMLAYILLTLLITVPAYANIQTPSSPLTDSIIESADHIDYPVAAWWDWGYFYQYLNKQTLWAPNSYNSHRALWMSKFYLSDDPIHAQRLLQTMSCGGDIGLTKYIDDLSDEGLESINRVEKSFCDMNMSVVVHNDDISEVMNMASILDKDLVISRLSKCVKGKTSYKCDNGYLFNDNEVQMNKKHPKAFYNYISNNTIKYNDSNVDFAFVAFERKGNVYSFMITEQYAGSIFARMISGDEIEGFDLTYYNDDIIVYVFSSNTSRSLDDV